MTEDEKDPIVFKGAHERIKCFIQLNRRASNSTGNSVTWHYF